LNVAMDGLTPGAVAQLSICIYATALHSNHRRTPTNSSPVGGGGIFIIIINKITIIIIIIITYRHTRTTRASRAPPHLELVYLVTAFVPSLTACLANSPGNRSLTEVCTSLEVMVERLL
jgi:hypothetical protein